MCIRDRIYSDADLTITGSGSLTVNANYNDGITSKDDLYILSGNITVTSKDDALRGKDSLTVAGGTIKVTSGGDGLKSDQDSDTTKGYVNITGGTIEITSTGDGIQGETDVIITGGDTTIIAGGGASSGKDSNNCLLYTSVRCACGVGHTLTLSQFRDYVMRHNKT